MTTRTRLQKIIALWPILAALASGAAGAYAWSTTQVQKRISRAINAHDREFEKDAHPSIQVRLKTLEDYWTAHTKEHDRIYQRLDAAEKQLYELYWLQVGIRASELERDRRKRAQAADRARERFRQYVRDGEGLKDAYRHALETRPPW